MTMTIDATSGAAPLRVIIVEDLRCDAELMLEQLAEEGFTSQWQLVCTEADYRQALATAPDVILCDWRLPRFSGERALELRQELCPDTPFLIVSGRIGEEAAVDCIHAGADDYVLKDRLARLGPAVRRAVAYRREQQHRQRAESADEAKREFLAAMSHDLRTPLNAILGFSAVLLSGPAGELSAEQREQITLIETAGRQLLAIISDLLDVARIEAGRLELQQTSLPLQLLLHAQCEALRLQAASRGLTLTAEPTDPSLRVRADAGRVNQVLANLIANAVKFTDRGGITVRAEAMPELVRIVVEDTGLGIPPDMLEQIFDPYRRGPSSTVRTREGTGLGLAICRKLITAMGGEIGVDSILGNGSRFWFTLPRA